MTDIEPADPTRYQREWSPRKARICPKCNTRHIGDLTWTCPEHGIAEDQEDRPYLKQYPKAERPSMTTDSGAFPDLPGKPADGLTYGSGRKAAK